MDGHFTTVFDIAVAGFKDWQFSAFGLIFVAIGTAIFFAPTIIRRLGLPFMDFPSKRLTFFRYAFLGFALFWTAVAFLTTYGTYSRHRALAASNGCTTVEGPVMDFTPMPSGGHGEESFLVSGIRFSYSDFMVSDAFNITASRGGPIKKDAYVRICYDRSDNAILRFAIRNFHGTADYSHSDSLIPDFPPSTQLTGQPFPDENWMWLADVWVALYFLDILATLAMFPPYLRTFWRFKTMAANLDIPPWLEGQRKTKLRNNLAYWDIPNSTVWLRPRGPNFLRMHFAVAKLNVDEARRSIADVELRFSSVVPVVFLLFFFTAYQMFSEVAPESGPPPAILLGFMALFFLVGLLLQGRRMIRRMEILIQEALGELGRPSQPAGRE